MDRYLRFFIKFHGYCIAIVSLILAIYLTVWASTDTNVEWEKYVGIVFGILWFIASGFLLLALVIEDKRLIFPFCTFYSIAVLLYVVGPLVLMFAVNPWYLFYLLSPIFPCVFFLTAYVVLSMAALVRLFDLEVNSSSDSEPALV